MPGVPRIMYMPFPFHIYQTPEHIAITFEWSQVHRTIYTNGVPGPEGIEFWMGDSRGRWEGDTLVVDVTDHNDQHLVRHHRHLPQRRSSTSSSATR